MIVTDLQNNMNVKIKSLAVAAALVVLAGCSDSNMSDLKEYVEQVKQRAATQIEPIPEVEDLETKEYEAVKAKDPFKQTFREQIDDPSKMIGFGPDLERDREPLEDYPLDSLKLVGNMKKNEIHWGLVRSPKGELFRVREGDYVGQNFGKVMGIREGEIDLRELIPDGLGGWEERLTTMALSE